MSTDAVAWAGAYPLPFDTARQRQRAKAVLKSLGQYAGVDGRSWVTMAVLLVETDLGHERTVQRGLADLKAAQIITDTGEWKTFHGRRYPIYQLHLDQGPRNTRERLRSVMHDVDGDVAADGGDAPEPVGSDGADVGATELSPQAARGDSPDGRGDGTVGLGVTPVSPKGEVKTQAKPTTGAREAVFDRMVRDCPQRMLRFVDMGAARSAWTELAEAGEDLEAIAAGLARMAADAEFQTYRRPPQLHDWLGKGMWHGWRAPGPDAGASASSADGGAAGADPDAPPALPRDVADVVYSQGPDWVKSWLRKGRWLEADRMLVCALSVQRDEVVRRLGSRLGELGVAVKWVKELKIEGVG